MKKINLLLLLLSALIINAQEKNNSQDSLKTYYFNPMVVTGTRIQLEKSKIPASISVIDNKTIEASAEPNILSVIDKRIPGIFINERNILGSGAGSAAAGGISIRGISGESNTRVLILIDGQPQFMGLFGHPFPDTYMSSDIERVEVIRGPASILYGSNAFAGAINLITYKHNKKNVSFTGNGSYGSFNTRELSLSSNLKSELYRLNISLNSNSTDGHRKDGDDSFNSTSAYLNAGMKLNDNLNASIDGSISDSKYFDPGATSNPLRNNFYKYLRARSAVSVENSFEKVEGAAKLFFNYGNHDFYDGWNSKDYTTGLTFYQNIRYMRNSILTFGIDYKKYGGKGINSKLPIVLKGLNEFHWIDERELYLLAQHSISEQFILNAGYRFTSNSVYGSENTPQFGFSYGISDRSTLKGSVGKSFRSPSVVDLYLFPVSNPNLKPERMWNYELTYASAIFSNNLSVELTAYYSQGSDMIQTVSGVPGVPPQKNNTGAFINKGIEFNSVFIASEVLDFNLGYNFLNSNVQLKYAPKHNLLLGVDYKWNKFYFDLNFKYSAGLVIDLAKSIRTDFTRLDAMINYSFADWMSLYTRIENLLDNKYEIDLGYPAAPFNFSIGIKITN